MKKKTHLTLGPAHEGQRFQHYVLSPEEIHGSFCIDKTHGLTDMRHGCRLRPQEISLDIL